MPRTLLAILVIVLLLAGAYRAGQEMQRIILAPLISALEVPSVADPR
jgi:hypothetical protein